MLFRQCQTLMELIDTQWDVNVIEYNKGFLNAKELIDTQWDVNDDMTVDIRNLLKGINRYIVGCKSVK